MAHFGSQRWPSEYGVVASLTNEAASPITGIAGSDTTLTSTEGVDQLTYSVPTGETALYRVTCHILNGIDSASGGTQLVTPQLVYNDGAAVALIDLEAILGGGGGGAAAAIDLSTAETTGTWRGVIKAAAGTDIVVAIEHILNSTVATAGTYEIRMSIEKLT